MPALQSLRLAKSSLSGIQHLENDGHAKTLMERSHYLKLKLSDFENYIARTEQFVKLFKKLSSQQDGSKGKKCTSEKVDEVKDAAKLGAPQQDVLT